MDIIRTLFDEHYIRLEDENEAAVTVFYHDKTAHLVSVFVPKDNRKCKAASQLLEAMEDLLFEMGIMEIESDFPKSATDVYGFLEACDYELKEDAPVVSIDTKKLLSAERIEKLLQKKDIKSHYIALKDLSMEEWDSLYDFLKQFFMRMEQAEITRASQSMSGVVFDTEGQPRAVMFTSEHEKEVHVELLAIAGEIQPDYVEAVLQGVLLNLKKNGGSKLYPKILTLIADERVEKLIEYLLSDEKPDFVETSIFAKKRLQNRLSDAYEIYDDLDEFKSRQWRKEIQKLPMQENIGWKPGWHRQRILHTQKQ